MSLSSLIVQREIATIRAVEEALSRQVLYGGDLVTNLLEVTALDEAKLNTATADDFGLIAGPPGILPAPADDRARKTLPVELAARRSIYPLQMSPDGQQLIVAVAEPFSPEEEEQLMFALGVPIAQRIVPLVRIRQALSREFDLPLERRHERLAMRLSGENITSSSRPPIFNEAPGAALPPGPDLRARPGFIGSPRPPDVSPRRVTSTGFLAVRDSTLAAVPGTIVPHRIVSISSEAPVPDTDPTPAPTPTDVDSLPPVIESASANETRSQGPTAMARANLLRNIGASPSKPPRQRLRPLTFADARKELENVADRDGILDLVFDFGRQFFDYAALFVVHGDIAEGRDAYGPGASRDQVAGIGVPLDLPGLLATARNSRGPVVQAPSHEGLDAVMIGDLHRGARAAVAVVPVIVRTRAVAMLYGDAGDVAVTHDAIADVITFATLAGQAFEKLILKKKLGGFTGGSASAKEGRVSSTVTSAMAPKSVGSRGNPISYRPEPETSREVPNAIRRSEPPIPIPQRGPQKRPSDRSERAEALGRALFTNATVSVSQGSPPAGSVEANQDSPMAASMTPEQIAEHEHPTMEFSVPRKRPHTPTYNSNAPPDEIPVIDESTPTFALTTLPRPSGRPPIPREDPIDPTLRPPERVFGSDSAPPQTYQGHVADDEARSIFDEIAEEHFLDDSGYPQSEQQISLPPHLPPSSHNRAEPLPSVIVEVSAEVTDLIDRYLNDPRDEQAQAGLVRLGEQAMPAIMPRFPGPITNDTKLEEDEPPTVSSCGPILRLIAAQRRIALPFVIPHLNVTDEIERFWATFLLTELPYVEALAGLLPRLHDPIDRIRRAGRLAIRAIDRAHGEVVARELGKIVRDDDVERQRRALMIEVLEDLRESFAVPPLVMALSSDDEEVAQHARRALVTLTRQDFGSDPQRWAQWWKQNASRHRIEWLIDSLVHEHPSIRNASGEELKALTKEYFGYYDDLPRRERDKAQQRYREWWQQTGRARFVAK
ncbi:MAG: hypothetical protein ABI183_12070 [Polyangiaceae bacterium]